MPALRTAYGSHSPVMRQTVSALRRADSTASSWWYYYKTSSTWHTMGAYPSANEAFRRTALTT